MISMKTLLDSIRTEALESACPEPEPTTITICPRHDERPTPLIWTFAFMGAEYWCPWCGHIGGMFGAGMSVEATDELAARLAEDTERTAEYRHACAVQVCSYVEWQGKRIRPGDLPDEEKQRLQAIRESWVYPATAEETK